MTTRKVRRKPKPEPPVPTLEKLREVHNESQKIGSFLEWLLNEKGIHLVRYHEHSEECHEDGCRRSEHYAEDVRLSTEQLLADYFEIDLAKVEKERVALLDWVREQNEAGAV